MRKILMVLMLAVALTSAGGCASKKPKPGASQSTEVGNNTADAAGAGSDAANAGNVGSDEDAAGPQGGLLAKRIVYFDFDSSDIKGEGNDVVAAHSKYLASHASTRVRLEGNTDDRGSREYNIGLGERRAQAVRRALLLQGATEAQIATVSYGAERPAVVGNDEAAWSKNRRVEIVYLAPGGQPAPVQPQR
ncbi:MAG: peptidoglycan-associated lipoprotein [Gammaproteobacteria bacterium]|jgi:peptidoglycan-associated lipoprotein|nr:peptidoglycan-associated lipoprotein [Gammaproteobacteria bacterium]HWM71308.1 peptidoglycan-associated lipoprotein Pal [Steroidobacteraceae bacterium]